MLISVAVAEQGAAPSSVSAGSTLSYRSVLDVEGRLDLLTELDTLSKQGLWTRCRNASSRTRSMS